MAPRRILDKLPVRSVVYQQDDFDFPPPTQRRRLQPLQKTPQISNTQPIKKGNKIILDKLDRVSSTYSSFPSKPVLRSTTKIQVKQVPLRKSSLSDQDQQLVRNTIRLTPISKQSTTKSQQGQQQKKNTKPLRPPAKSFLDYTRNPKQRYGGRYLRPIDQSQLPNLLHTQQQIVLSED